MSAETLSYPPAYLRRLTAENHYGLPIEQLKRQQGSKFKPPLSPIDHEPQRQIPKKTLKKIREFLLSRRFSWPF